MSLTFSKTVKHKNKFQKGASMQREHRTTDFQHEEFQTMNTDPISYAQVKMKSIMNASDFLKLQDED